LARPGAESRAINGARRFNADLARAYGSGEVIDTVNTVEDARDSLAAFDAAIERCYGSEVRHE